MTSIRHLSALRLSLAPLLTGLLWCAAALGAGYWFWHLPFASASSSVSTPLAPNETSVPAVGQLPRALGVSAANVTAETDAPRVQLVGVIASLSGQGSALIALDGQAPKPYRVGQAVGEGLVLQSLSPKRALLGASMTGPTLRDISLRQGATP
ncbi:hypothetical protein B9Z38_03525 [Limnohabitans sp. MMS-10A-160]|jgi:general secretion pathway protein C|uniref:type II secretion system protein N n=1 Tax=unclassified Limnohabitans TaxID=2626134 RepID=UPI000D39BF7F|nr:MULTISPECIES: type II secretion system protein N [unclassified Limnohabitans]PUE18131.1 hypothetical protein B9Z43_13320 [Limnohabitans sp. MMS-10A-192]PUE27358.1 hypothetical protein B9Z38_03525 [Limnohabitans sp. MMS-10A-160]